ncbi:MAG: ABC transporter permease [Methanobacterium sp. ERen5]|nr:MAG: ABC transporter permease [Methanobacterium sp. ERen5]
MLSLKLTLSTSFLAALFVMIISVPTAYSLSRYEFPLKNFIKTIIDLPMAFPEIIIGLGLLIILGNGFLSNILSYIGIEVLFTPNGIILAQFFVSFPYAVRILYSTFSYIDPRYEFVSRSLGAGEFKTLINITLPLAKGGLIAGSVVCLARCIGAFAAVLLIGGGTFLKTETLPVTIYYNLSLGNIDSAITAGIVLLLISFIIIFVLETYCNFEGMNN